MGAKIGVATCISKTELTNNKERCETLVKQPATFTSGGHVNIAEQSEENETYLNPTGLSSSPPDAKNLVSTRSAEGCISLHEDESLPMRGREMRQQPHQPDEVQAHVESVETCSDNCANLSVSSNFSQFSMDTLFCSLHMHTHTHMLAPIAGCFCLLLHSVV